MRTGEVGTAAFSISTDEVEPFSHFFETSVGSGHMSLTLREDWRNHIRMAARDLGVKHIRVRHRRRRNMLTDRAYPTIRPNPFLLSVFAHATRTHTNLFFPVFFLFLGRFAPMLSCTCPLSRSPLGLTLLTLRRPDTRGERMLLPSAGARSP